MLDLAILGLLDREPLHGYELKKRLRALLGRTSSVSFGSLYPALARLEGEGAVSAVDAPAHEPGIPATGALSGEVAAFRARRRPRVGRRGTRGKKVYDITDAGRDRLQQLLGDEPGSGRTADGEFRLRVAFCRLLPPSQRRSLFASRRRQVAADLSDAETRAGDGATDADPYIRSLHQHDVESLRHELAWLDQLIDHEPAATPA